MKLTDYADAINVEIKLTYYPNQKNRWCASMTGVVIMEDKCLISTHKSDVTPARALDKYARGIRGKRICIGARTDHRIELTVPSDLMYGTIE